MLHEIEIVRLCHTYPIGEMGRTVSSADYGAVIGGRNVDVYKPNGERLLCLRVRAVTPAAMQAALPLLRLAKTLGTNNRGMAAGGERRDRIKKGDGSKAKTTEAAFVHSSIFGAFERVPRFPYCRQTAYTAKHLTDWQAAQQLFTEVAACYAQAAPERFAAQSAMAAATHPDWVIPGTPWTTLTLNHNWPTNMHTDKGDLIGPGKGFGCLFAHTTGDYEGGLLVFPRYRVAVDLRDCDVLFADTHEAHGNTAMAGPKGFERYTGVLYYRTKMIGCTGAAAELARVQAAEGKIR